MNSLRSFAFFLLLTNCVTPLQTNIAIAKKRWFNATGIVPHQQDVEVVDDPVPCADLENSAGCTTIQTRTIKINGTNAFLTNDLLQCVVLHELGHVISKSPYHVRGENHVMSRSPEYWYHCTIDDADIDFVCTTNHCTKHVAER